jgi:hypothetical protein
MNNERNRTYIFADSSCDLQRPESAVQVVFVLFFPMLFRSTLLEKPNTNFEQKQPAFGHLKYCYYN